MGSPVPLDVEAEVMTEDVEFVNDVVELREAEGDEDGDCSCVDVVG